MSIELEKKKVSIGQLIYDDKKRFMVEGEVNVPDIKPDILNLANVYADCFVTETEILDGRVKVEGTVDTYLIYLADDDEGSVRSMMYSFRFTEYVEVPGILADTPITLKCHVIRSRSKGGK